MSSTTSTANIDVTSAPAATKNIRTVARKNSNKRKAEEPLVDAAAPAPVAVAAPAAPKAAKKPRAKKAAAADNAVPADASNAPVDATNASVDASAAAVPAPAKKPRTKKAATVSVAVDAAAPVTSAAPVAVAAASKKTKEPQPPFIEGYGDDEKPEGPELYSDEMFDLYRAETRRRLEFQTKTKWAKQKKSYRKSQAKKLIKSRKVARAVKQLDESATADKLRERLQSVDSAVFSVLDGKWLSTFSFNGMLTATQLNSINKANVDPKVLTAIAVYEVAVSKGVRPLGIVSENRKKDGETSEMKYIESVAGDRFYIGKKLPYFPAPYKEGSPFVLLKEDKVYIDAPVAAPSTEN
jgi:hypothetical protein